MTPDAKDWLPPSALSDGALCVSLTERAVAWSRRWFGSAEGVGLHLHRNADEARIPVSAICWESACQRLSLAIDRPNLLRVAAGMLGMKNVGAKLAGPDLTLLRGLAAACLEDLLHNAGEVFGVRSEIRRIQDLVPGQVSLCGLWYSVGFGVGGRALDIHVRGDAAVSARKALISHQQPRQRPALGSLQDAIARQNIKIGARIGSGRIGLSEMFSLARGDVLVLDTAVSDAFDLTVNGDPHAGVGCELLRDGPIFKLRVTQIEGGVGP